MLDQNKPPLSEVEAKAVRKMLRAIMPVAKIPLTEQTLVNWRQKQIPHKWHYQLLETAQAVSLPLTREQIIRFGQHKG